MSTLKNVSPNNLSELILDCAEDTETTLTNFYKIFERYFKESNSSNLTLIFLDYIAYCQGIENKIGKLHFLKSINLIINNLGTSKFSHSLLGIAIEQSRLLLDSNDLDYINQRLQDVLPFYNVRVLAEQRIITTTTNQDINLEIHVFDNEPTCFKLAIMLVLFLIERPEMMDAEDSKVENFCLIWLYGYSPEMKAALDEQEDKWKEQFSDNNQSLHLEKTDYSIQEMIVINKDFPKFSNLYAYPDNMVTPYFLTLAIAGIKGHFYHTDIKNNSNERLKILQSIANMYDYTSNDVNKSAYNINFESFE